MPVIVALTLYVIVIVALVHFYLLYNFGQKSKKQSPEEIRLLRDRKRKDRLEVFRKQVALRHAMDKGLNVNSLTIEQMIEIYRNDAREEGIAAAIKKLGLTRAEAIEQDYVHGSAQVYAEVSRRRRSKEVGREVTHQEVLDDYRERLRNSKYPGPDCLQPWEIEHYRKNNEWPDKKSPAHLELCSSCYSLAETLRPVKLPESGPDCYSKEELDQVVEIGVLPEGRFEHKNSCQLCESRLSHSQRIFIEKTVPFPESPEPVNIFDELRDD
jgi:hypothetical protein